MKDLQKDNKERIYTLEHIIDLKSQQVITLNKMYISKVKELYNCRMQNTYARQHPILYALKKILRIKIIKENT